MYEELKEIKSSGGRTAGWFCSFVPVELLDAAGFAAVDLTADGKEFETFAEKELPTDTCPLVKACYGQFFQAGGPEAVPVDLVVAETGCDGKKKMYDRLADKVRLYVLQLPQGPTEAYARRLWRDEIHRFSRFLEEFTGEPLTDEKLRAAARARNEYREIRRQINGLLAQDGNTVPAASICEALEKMAKSPTVELAIKRGKAFLGQAEKDNAAAGADARERSEKCPRILVTGSPLYGVEEKILGSVESAGGRVVCLENCTGIKAALCEIDAGADDILDEIADAYLQIGCAIMTPNVYRLENVKTFSTECRADGILDVTLQSCRTYGIETHKMNMLADELEKPYLSIETNFSDSDVAQIRTRLEAFMELLS